jgi:hypothetical protein
MPDAGAPEREPLGGERAPSLIARIATAASREAMPQGEPRQSSFGTRVR